MILSPYGEGYCRVCRFIVGLNANGLVERHTRLDPESAWGWGRKLCPGRDRTPPKRIPFAAGKSRFRIHAKKTECPLCHRRVRVNTFTSGEYITRHTPTPWTAIECDAGGTKIK